MRIAVPFWDNRISPVFDVAQNLMLISFHNGKETARFNLSLAGMSSPLKIDTLKKNEVEIVLCGAISEPFLRLLISSGFTVEPWISGRVEDVIQAVLQNRLSDPCYRMPGYCRYKEKGRQYRNRKHNKNN